MRTFWGTILDDFIEFVQIAPRSLIYVLIGDFLFFLERFELAEFTAPVKCVFFLFSEGCRLYPDVGPKSVFVYNCICY